MLQTTELKIVGFITKFLAWAVVIALSLVAAVCVAVYVPWVQQFAADRASGIVAVKTGMQVSVDRFRVRFPLRVSLRGTTVVSRGGDTLLQVDRVTTGVAFPLRALRDRQVRVRRIVVAGADVRVPVSVPDSLPSSRPRGDTIIPVVDWGLEVRRIEISDSRLSVVGFDFRELALEARDVVYDRGEVRVDLRDLRFLEAARNLRLDGASGVMALRRAQEPARGDEFSVENLELVSGRTHLSLSARAGSSIVELAPETAVELTVEGSVSMEEIERFMQNSKTLSTFASHLSSAPRQFEQARLPSACRRVNFQLSTSGTLASMDVDRLVVELPGTAKATAYGSVGSVLDPARIKGSVTATAEIENSDFAKGFLPDTIRLGLPRAMTMKAKGAFSTTAFDIEEFTLAAAPGTLDARGKIDLEKQTYTARLGVRNFPVGDFLPRDSLGSATFFANIRGRGFDPVGGIHARARVNVRRFDWKRYNLHDVDLAATVDGEKFEIDLTSDNELLKTQLAASGVLAKDRTEANVRTGDLSLDVVSPLAVTELVGASTEINAEVRKQLAARHFSADSLQGAFPEIRLTARAGRGNFLSEMAHGMGVDFADARADISTTKDAPFSIDARVTQFVMGKVVLDTVSLAAHRSGAMLDYDLRMAGRRSRNALVGDHLGLIEVSGNVGGNSLTIDLLQQNQKRRTGFRVGAVATLRDSTLHVKMTPFGPTLAYEQWTVDGAGMGGDWLEVGLDGALGADLQLTGDAPGKYINLSSAALADTPQALRLDAAGLDIAAALELFPTMPQTIGGLFFSGATFGFLRQTDQRNIVASGSVGVEDFTYSGRRIADVEARVDFQTGASGAMELDADLLLDRVVGVSARGTYVGDEMDFSVNVPRLPLSLADGFVPADAGARLSGNLDGEVSVKGTTADPLLAGNLGFTNAAARIGMTGTTLKISPERITVEGRKLNFNNIGITSPNNQKLTLGGGLDFTDMARPTADISLRTRNFRPVSSTHIGGSQVYGTAAMDAGITARGPLSALTVRGDIDILSATDIIYIMRSQSRVRDERQHIVEFTEFADTLYNAPAPEIASGLRPRVDMLVGVTIDDGARAVLSLDEQNENRVELVGGGDLTFSMNTQGDVRLSGRYELTGGTVFYRPPMIAQKVFAVERGSYVEWKGAAADPEFHVSATQTMEVELTYDDGMGEQVEFDISVDISGTLGRMDMRFDLSAPGNLAIQNQLLSMDAEERMRQALALLLYGQYTGPGVSSKGASFDARKQIADFISREVNQWARNNLRGVDFSMGIDQRTDGTTGGMHTDYSYSVSKTLFSDRVKVSVGGSVSDSATGDNFGNNLLEDVSLEYRINPSGTVQLKVYRYNTRESILEGEVTETGAGFVMRKKVNRIGDIFRNRNRQRNGR